MSAADRNCQHIPDDSQQQLQQQIILLNQRVRILEGECKELDKARTAEKAQRERCTLLAAKISELEAQLRKSLADLKLAQGRGLGFAGIASQAVDTELRCKMHALQQQLLEETQKLRLTESHAEIAKADASKWEKLAKDAESKVTSLEITLKDMKGIADQRVRDSIAASEVKVAASEKLLRDTREHLQRSVIQAEAATEQAATSHKLAVNLQLRIDELLRSDSAPIIASMQQQLVAAAAKQKLVADAAAAAQADFARVSRELSSSQAALAVAHADLSLNSKLLQEERDLLSRVRVQLSEALLRVQHAEAELESEHTAHSMMEHQLRAQKAKVETTNNINRLNLLIRIAEVSKLEDMLKAVKRVEMVREEVIALLVYNISASEGQDLRSNAEAAEMQKRVRTERMEAMRKKVKSEESKMKQAAETFATTASRLKSKIAELESTLKATEVQN